MSLEGEQRPQHHYPPYQAQLPTYPEALQQLLTGPEPDLSGGPAVSPGYRNKQTQAPVVGHHCECWDYCTPML